MTSKRQQKGGEIRSLEALCARMETHEFWPYGRAWHGDVSDIRLAKQPVLLARKLGYQPPDDHEFHPISTQKAAQILAYLCRESLAYGRPRYLRQEANAIEKMLLEELGPSAMFWSSNTGEHLSEFGDDEDTSYTSDVPLSSATFEFGVIGTNQSRGFIFWVEDED
jgi:hypothetical protein